MTLNSFSDIERAQHPHLRTNPQREDVFFQRAQYLPARTREISTRTFKGHTWPAQVSTQRSRIENEGKKRLDAPREAASPQKRSRSSRERSQSPQTIHSLHKRDRRRLNSPRKKSKSPQMRRKSPRTRSRSPRR